MPVLSHLHPLLRLVVEAALAALQPKEAARKEKPAADHPGFGALMGASWRDDSSDNDDDDYVHPSMAPQEGIAPPLLDGGEDKPDASRQGSDC